jgi:hypothetical protein
MPVKIKNLVKNPKKGGIPAKDKNKNEVIQIKYLFFKKENSVT